MSVTVEIVFSWTARSVGPAELLWQGLCTALPHCHWVQGVPAKIAIYLICPHDTFLYCTPDQLPGHRPRGAGTRASRESRSGVVRSALAGLFRGGDKTAVAMGDMLHRNKRSLLVARASAYGSRRSRARICYGRATVHMAPRACAWQGFPITFGQGCQAPISCNVLYYYVVLTTVCTYRTSSDNLCAEALWKSILTAPCHNDV